MHIYDRNNQRRDLDWLIDQFGDVRVRRSANGEHPLRLVKLKEMAGPPIIIVTVLDETGAPLPGIMVARNWDHPALEPLPSELSEWGHEWGIWSRTNEQGRIGFVMGDGDRYTPPAGGASAIWCEWGADLVQGLGLVGSTEARHLDLVYQRDGVVAEELESEPIDPEPVPDPDPVGEGDGGWDVLFEKLDEIVELLEEGIGDG